MPFFFAAEDFYLPSSFFRSFPFPVKGRQAFSVLFLPFPLSGTDLPSRKPGWFFRGGQPLLFSGLHFSVAVFFFDWNALKAA